MIRHRFTLSHQAFGLFCVLLIAGMIASGCAAAPAPTFHSAPTGGSALPPPSALDIMAQAAPAGDGGELAGVPMSAAQPRQMIARASITLVVTETEQTVSTINQLMVEMGGYVSNANLYKSQYGESELLQGTLTLRVPAERTDEALARLEVLAVSVRGKTLNREDVTDQYTDLQAQLRNLQATENELRELLAEVRAKPNARPEDILTVHQHLTNIRGQIEQVQGRRNMFDNLIALATIDVTLTPDPISLPLVVEGWRAGVVLRSALSALVEALRGLATAVIWLVVYLLPLALMIALVVGVVAWPVYWFARRMFRRAPSGMA